jgi:hypothetical protein
MEDGKWSRIPKLESPNSERNPKPEAAGWCEHSRALFPKGWQTPFGIRISGFFRISDFELRISGLTSGFYPPSSIRYPLLDGFA